MTETQFELPKVYDPKQVEEKWLDYWLKNNFFRPEVSGTPDQNYSIVIPPPNVTGSLHMGHALNNTIQDILVRYQRMNGKNVLWVVGTDHAGIATQNVVERELKKEGKKRQDLGREKFIERVWEWKQQSGGSIINQLKRLGASCDWSRERFTMDEGLSKAVREVFVRLYEKGLIYRDKYLINWCPRCLTALSDIEVEHEETNGSMWHIRYTVAGAPTTEIIVATTRPETLLGDTAVAVHPDDERYKDLIGKKLILPLVNREIPIISDHRVDKEFGTGAVKVTPAHDFNDFMFGNDHQLERINIFTPDAKMNENAGIYQGLDRYEARKKIVEDLESAGFLIKTDPHKLSVGHCYRCKTIVEPYLSLQWFVKTKPLADRALKAVHDGKTTFYPENWTKVYEQWMEGIKDWCISRQIWWGHRIPAWYCCKSSSATYHQGTPQSPSSGRLASESFSAVPLECPPIVSRETPVKCPQCGSTDLVQETDVLDTWFSSALWPFSTLGWPEQTPELKAFYPTSVLVTGFDIIFFWVARMMMMGLEFMDEVPFKHVYIHALVRDAHGQKMSKSKGNVVDPLSVMEKYGTDAFRFTLAALAAQGRDVKLSDQTIEGYRNFCNKVWNAARYSLTNLQAKPADLKKMKDLNSLELTVMDKWILTEWDQTIGEVRAAIESYHFDDAAKTMYQFFWRSFCDWYLEFSKVSLTPEVLQFVLDESLRALHPFMPYITEEIWQSLPSEATQVTITKASYPEKKNWNFVRETKTMNQIIQIISSIRNIRGENRISPKEGLQAILSFPEASLPHKEGQLTLQNELKPYENLLVRFGGLKEVVWKTEKIVPKKMAHAALESLDVYIPLEGLVDFDAELKRIEKEIGRLKEDTGRRETRLQDPSFVNRADAEVVEEERKKVEENKAKIGRFEDTLRNFS